MRRPSHSVMNSVLTLTTWSCSNTLRVLMKQSISSMKMMDGASLFAMLHRIKNARRREIPESRTKAAAKPLSRLMDRAAPLTQFLWDWRPIQKSIIRRKNAHKIALRRAPMTHQCIHHATQIAKRTT